MKRKYIHKLLVPIISILVLSGNCFSQDSHLSMFYAAPNVLNPAMTGRFDGYYRAHLQYRQQWYSVMRNPFTTTVASFDKAYRKFGVGTYIKNNKAGVGGYNVMNVLISGAYEITSDPLKINHLSAGVQLGFIQKSIRADQFTFNNQYSKDYEGGDFNPSLNSNEFFPQESIMLPEISFGIHYYKTDRNKMFNPFIGASAFHLTSPEETFLGSTNNLPIRYVGYGGTDLKINTFYRLQANALFMREKNVNEFAGGTLVYYEPEGDIGFYFGPYYRHKDAIQIHTGVEYGEFNFGFSYDINTSGLSEHTKKQGGFEFSITYIKHKGKYIPSIL